jgi:hypothetical protein
MKRILKIEIECGASTCASKPGRFCPELMFKKFGSVPVCRVFDTELYELKGWTMRCPQCMEAEVKGVGNELKE